MTIVDLDVVRAMRRPFDDTGVGRLDTLIVHRTAIDGLRTAMAGLEDLGNIVEVVEAIPTEHLALIARACAAGAGDRLVVDPETLKWRCGDASGEGVASALANAAGLSQEQACLIVFTFIGHGLLTSLAYANDTLRAFEGMGP